MDSDKVSDGNLTGGSKLASDDWKEFVETRVSLPSTVLRSNSRPSSREIDTFGEGPSDSSVVSPVSLNLLMTDAREDPALSLGNGTESPVGVVGEMPLYTEVLVDNIDMRLFPEPCVLTLNLEDAGAFHEMMLSLFPSPLFIILCLLVLWRTFFSAAGKYAVRCCVINSLGGRCPKKFRSLDCGFDGLRCGPGESDGEL